MRPGWRGVLGIALSALLLWWTLHGANLGEVWRVLTTSSIPLWIASAVAATAIFPLRARRWQAILAPRAGRLPLPPLWRATAIGMMVNNVFPARAGEFARAFALSRARPDVPFTTAFASLVVDRLFDGTVVLAMLLLATLDPRFPADATIYGMSAARIAASAAAFLAVVLAGVAALVFFPALVIRVVERTVGAVWPGGKARVHDLLTAFAAGLGVVREPALALEVLFWTVLHWIVNALAFWLGFKALGVDAPLSAAFFLQGLIAIGVAVPSSPGFFGVFEAASKVGLGLYGVSTELAVSWGLGFHILSFIPITVIGAWYFSRMHLHVSDLSAP
jgi:uncharacterized protein (TIRG00374 family)